MPKFIRVRFLGSDGLFCMCQFGSFKNLFATITSLPELYFRFGRFILWVETKKLTVIKKSTKVVQKDSLENLENLNW